MVCERCDKRLGSRIAPISAVRVRRIGSYNYGTYMVDDGDAAALLHGAKSMPLKWYLMGSGERLKNPHHAAPALPDVLPST